MAGLQEVLPKRRGLPSTIEKLFTKDLFVEMLPRIGKLRKSKSKVPIAKQLLR
jgi:hypothetical protein